MVAYEGRLKEMTKKQRERERERESLTKFIKKPF